MMKVVIMDMIITKARHNDDGNDGDDYNEGDT